MAVKILADKIQIGNYNLYENPYGIVFDGVIKAEGYQEAVDSFQGSTILNIKTNGVSNSNNYIFKDESDSNLVVTGVANATTSSFTPYSNNYSVYFDGSGDYLSVTSNNVFSFQTNDTFMIECWVNFLDGNTNSLRMIWTNYNTWTTNSMFFGKHTNQSGRVALWINNYSTGVPLLEDPTLPPTGEWTHYAVLKRSSTWVLYRDGQPVANASWGGDPTGVNNVCQIGGNSEASGAYCLNGWISNMRIMKGTAPYANVPNGSFIPFNTKISQGSNANVSGIFCQSNRFLDTSNNNFTVSIGGGTPQISPYSPLLRPYEYTPANNAGSVYLDGTGDYITVAANTAIQPGTGDFTFEFWFYPTSTLNAQYVIYQNFNNSNNGYGNFLVYYDSGSLRYYSSTTGSSWDAVSNQNIGSLTQNTWNYVAVSRSSGTMRLFMNGTLTTSFADSSNLTNSGNVDIGGNVAGARLPYGYISGFRFEKGKGYTSMPVPTTPPSKTTNTTLLLNFRDSGIYDASEYNAIETAGQIDVNTSVILFDSGTKKQGSIYFDGTGDYLKIPNSPLYNLGAADFTIEGWVNSQSNSVSLATIISLGWYFGITTSIVIFNNNGTLTAYASSDNANWNIMNAVTFGTLTLGTWHHIAVSRFGGTIRLYQDGVAKANVSVGTTTGLSFTTNQITLGAGSDGSSTYMFNGYMSDFRVSRGVARYTTATFTPPVFSNPVR
jgi:hypothetical protein